MTTSGVSPGTKTPMGRVAAASAIGSVIEFYDFLIFGTAAALVFPAVFFPALGEAAGSVASFATFAVAFVARPFGALFFGHFGDRIGRKRMLILTLTIMGTATFIVGVLPGAGTIGIAAPIILFTLRFFQGIAVGGEWAGAALLTAEYAPAARRGLWASMPQLGPSLGFALASATFLITNLTLGDQSDTFIGWAWRVPFIFSAVLVIIGFWIRLRIAETPVFTAEQERKAQATVDGAPKDRLAVLEVLRKQPREVFLASGPMILVFAFFYIGTAFLTSYGTTELGHSRPAVLLCGIIGALFFAVFTIIGGTLSDRFGRRKIIIGAIVASGIWSFALFPVLDIGTITSFGAGLSVTMLCLGVIYGPKGSFLPELFETRYRYTGAGMAYNLGGVLGGAVAPMVASALVATQVGSAAIGYMLVAICLIGLICMLALRETQGVSLHTEPALTESP